MRDIENRISKLEGEVVNVTRQADRLERDAIAYRQEMRDAVADINVKLDQLLGWTRPRGE